MRKFSTTWLKLTITLLGLALAAAQINLAELQAAFRQVHWPGLLLMFLLINASLVLRAARWWVLLRGLNRRSSGSRVPFGRLVVLYIAGNFFNVFLPSGFGGDVVRVVEAARDVPPAAAAGTVLVDRLTGLMVLFVFALLTLPFRPANFPPGQTLLVAGVSLAGLAGGFLLLDGRLLRRFGRRLPRLLSPMGDGPTARLLAAVQGCGWPAVGGALAISVLFNAMLVGWWVVAGISLDYAIPIRYYLLAVPLLSVTLLAPSIGGLGVREAVAPLLFAAAGLNHSQAVALSLLEFTIVRLSGLTGAPVYLWFVLRRSDKEMKT